MATATKRPSDPSISESASTSGAEPGPLSHSLSWLLSQASHALATELTAALEELEIAPRGRCVLIAARQGGRTQTDLAGEVGLDKTTMVTTVDELERAGLAARRPSDTDRRARVIELTPAGRRKLAQVEEIVGRVEGEVLATLPARQREALVAGLGTLVAGRLAEPSPCSRPVRRRD